MDRRWRGKSFLRPHAARWPHPTPRLCIAPAPPAIAAWHSGHALPSRSGTCHRHLPGNPVVPAKLREAAKTIPPAHGSARQFPARPEKSFDPGWSSGPFTDSKKCYGRSFAPTRHSVKEKSRAKVLPRRSREPALANRTFIVDFLIVDCSMKISRRLGV